MADSDLSLSHERVFMLPRIRKDRRRNRSLRDAACWWNTSSTGHPLSSAALPTKRSRLRQLHNSRDSIALALPRADTSGRALPKARIPRRYKIRIRTDRSVRGGQPCHPTGLPLISYSIPRPQRCSWPLLRCRRWFLQHAIPHLRRRTQFQSMFHVYPAVSQLTWTNAWKCRTWC